MLSIQQEFSSMPTWTYSSVHWHFFFILANSKETRKVETSTDKVKKETYDDDYFSSGSDDDNQVGGVPSKSKQRRKVLTNEELFYDPEMDEIDEKWVNKQRENNSMSGIVTL